MLVPTYAAYRIVYTPWTNHVIMFEDILYDKSDGLIGESLPFLFLLFILFFNAILALTLILAIYH